MPLPGFSFCAPDSKGLEAPPSASGAAAADGGASLPCQDSNNCIRNEPWGPQSNHLKTAWALEFNARAMVEEHGLENVAFLTLTFAEWVTKTELAKRWHSLNSNVFAKRYPDYIAVVERGGKNRRLHLHLIVALGWDCRTDFDFDLFEAAGALRASGDIQGSRKLFRRLGGPKLKAEWAFLRRILPRYGFGKMVELVPIRRTGEAIACYVGKYIVKHIWKREPEDKGMRLVRYSAGRAKATTRFMFATKGSKAWRDHVGAIAAECGFTDLSEFTEAFGSSWAYAVKNALLQEDQQPLEHDGNKDPVWNGEKLPPPLPPVEGRRTQVSYLLDDISRDLAARREERKMRRIIESARSRLWMEQTQKDP